MITAQETVNAIGLRDFLVHCILDNFYKFMG